VECLLKLWEPVGHGEAEPPMQADSRG
jgi:hypothetical protein